MVSPKDTMKVYLDCVDRIEPSVTDMDQEATLTSIAISLKRIADFCEWVQEHTEDDK